MSLKGDGFLELDKSRDNIAIRGKRGLHFILASIIIWSSILTNSSKEFSFLKRVKGLAQR